jgi:putative DNA primase/helicase
MVWVAAPMPEEKGGGCVLARAKSNIGPNGGGFQYRLAVVQLPDEVEATKLIWGEQLEGTAQALLAEAEEDNKGERHTARDEAKFWLTLALDDGARPAAEIQSQARAEGFSERTLRRAKKELKVKVFRAGGVADGGHWMWALPGLGDGLETVA